MKNNYEIACTCTFGLERTLKFELIDLGYSPHKVEDGKVFIKGDFYDIAKLNLHLRTATRVLLHITTFPAKNFDELFDNTNAYNWENYFGKKDSFNVSKITCVKSKIFSKRDSQKIIKKAIVERLKQQYAIKNLPETGTYYELIVNIKKDVANIYINTSGESLHRRGYRKSAGKAPLKETLAAGIVLLSRYSGDCPFADIMCGSGTIIIEAAMIAINMPPGMNRNFAFENWKDFDKRILSKLKKEAKENLKEPKYRLLGSDINYQAIRAAKENAELAGVSEHVAFQKLDMREFKSKRKYGKMVLNPPYAERLGDEKDVVKLYKDLKKVYNDLDSWSLYVLTAHPMFEKYLGKADKNRKLFNGNKLSYLYQYFGK